MKSRFTLLELMVSAIIFSSVLAIIFSLFFESSKIYEDNSQRLVFEYRVNKVLGELSKTLRESWLRNKQAIPVLPSPVPLTFQTSISMVNDAPNADPLHTDNNELLVFSIPNPANPFDDNSSQIIWTGADYFRLARADLEGNGIATIETLSEAITGKDYNVDGDLTDTYELRELVRSNNTSISGIRGRIIVLRETGVFPCVMTRDSIKVNGPAMSLRLNFLFYDPRLDQAIRGSSTVVLMNRQND